MTSSTTPWGRRAAKAGAAAVGIPAVAFGTYGAAGASAAAAASAARTAQTVPTASTAQAAPHRTTLTLDMPTCDRCVVQLFQGREGGTDHPTAWISREKRVEGAAR